MSEMVPRVGSRVFRAYQCLVPVTVSIRFEQDMYMETYSVPELGLKKLSARCIEAA